MNPEERHLLERAVKLSLENNEILHKMRRAARLAIFWGIIKIAIFVVPFVLGYIYLEPYFGSFGNTFKQAQEALKVLNQ
ncbi:MAG: hypothetical protein AAB660_01705 [Patescibacteria group bacterium]